MPLDVLGCTRATLMRSTSLRSCPKWLGNLFKMHRDGDRSLQLLIFNEEFLVSAAEFFPVARSFHWASQPCSRDRAGKFMYTSIARLLGKRCWATPRAPSPAPPPDNVGLRIAKLSKRVTWYAHCFEGARGRAIVWIFTTNRPRTTKVDCENLEGAKVQSWKGNEK